MSGQHNLEHENEALHKLRHSTVHVMAEAVVERFPDARIAIGPPIKDGFYYGKASDAAAHLRHGLEQRQGAR